MEKLRERTFKRTKRGRKVSEVECKKTENIMRNKFIFEIEM